MKPQDGTPLPDDTLVEDVILTGRARNLIWEYKTVGELRKLSDAELLGLRNCGKMTLLEIRLLTGQLVPGKLKRKSDEMLKGEWVREIAGGHCTCSFEDWRKEKDNAAG